MDIQENVSLAPKTTMQIGGNALYYADLYKPEECEEAIAFAIEKEIPLILLGGGSNTIFEDGTIQALVVRVAADKIEINGNEVKIECGKNLPDLVDELAKKGLDLSVLTGIPGSLGGAIVGNAGQGPKGAWIDSYINKVNVFTEDGWEEMQKSKCHFGYRESVFKHTEKTNIIWSSTLTLPPADPETIKETIKEGLHSRMASQPFTMTAGSCFKALNGVPAWKYIDAAGLKGRQEGGVQVSEKHANFLINKDNGTYRDAVSLVQTIEGFVGEPLDVEMRFIKKNGSTEF